MDENITCQNTSITFVSLVYGKILGAKAKKLHFSIPKEFWIGLDRNQLTIKMLVYVISNPVSDYHSDGLLSSRSIRHQYATK